jgi:hypothetical protein
MASPKRCTPYSYKKKGEYKKKEKLGVVEMEQAGIDVQNIKNRLELMTAEEMANTQQIASQNALKLFNELIEAVRRRIPNMSDETIVDSLLSIWDKTGAKK